MASLWKLTLHLLVILFIVHLSSAATPVFLQAISSALGAIPFTGFPISVTAGLTGAKLAVGGKLLYYLGLFGRGGQKANPVPPVKSQNTFGAAHSGFSPTNFQTFGAGFPVMQQGTAGGFMPQGQFMPPQGQFSGSAPVDPTILMQSLAAQGINPMQLMQALGDAGIDPAQLLQAIGGGPGKRVGQPVSPAFAPRSFSTFGAGGRPSFAQMGTATGGSRPPIPQMSTIPGGLPLDLSNTLPPSTDQDIGNEQSQSGTQEEDIDSFFSFLKDMDDNKCISRLICDIGADPDFLGEFTRNIDNIINSLDVPAESGAHEYIRIMENGRKEGKCAEKFQQCDDEAYEIVKSVAPSVGVPGIGSPDGS